MAMKIIAEKCEACGACADECPTEAISEDKSGDFYVIDPDDCIDCGECEESCPTEAIVDADADA